MRHLWLTAHTDVLESLRAKWFFAYTLIFGGLVALLFAFGLTESRGLRCESPFCGTHVRPLAQRIGRNTDVDSRRR
jgi:hypothetical protein